MSVNPKDILPFPTSKPVKVCQTSDTFMFLVEGDDWRELYVYAPDMNIPGCDRVLIILDKIETKNKKELQDWDARWASHNWILA